MKNYLLRFTNFLSLAFAFLFISQQALAAANNWELIDKKVHRNSLCEAFVDGQVSTFKRKSCSQIGCDEWLYQVKTTCQKNTTGVSNATIQHFSKDKIFSSETISQSKWAQFNANLLRMLAANIESYGNEFVIENVEELADQKLKVSFVVKRQGKPIENGYWIFGEGPSIPQVLERSQTRKVIVTETNTDTLVR